MSYYYHFYNTLQNKKFDMKGFGFGTMAPLINKHAVSTENPQVNEVKEAPISTTSNMITTTFRNLAMSKYRKEGGGGSEPLEVKLESNEVLGEEQFAGFKKRKRKDPSYRLRKKMRLC